MSAPIPPAPPPVPIPAAPGGVAVTVTVVNGAQAVQDMAVGTLLEVAMRLRARSVVEVISERGPLTLQLPRDAIPLPGGARMVLQLVQAGGEPTFRIISLNGRPVLPGGIPLLPSALPAPAPSGMTQAGTMAAAPLATAPGAASQAAPMAAGPMAPAGITATVLRPIMAPGTAGAQPNAASAGLPLDLAPGTQVMVRIAGTAPPQAAGPNPANPFAPATGGAPSVMAPAQAGAPTPQPGPSAPASPASPGVAASPATASAPASAPMPTAGAPVPNAAPAPLPAMPVPPAVPAPGAAPAPGGLLAGTITAHPPGGQAVVQTPAGTLAVPVPSDAGIGARVLLDVVGPPLPPATAGSANAPQGLSAAGWPALAETLDTLARADPKLAETLMNSLPQANARLGLTLSVMAAAIRSGEWRQLVSDPIRGALERVGRGELAARLKGDVEKLSADATRPLSGGGSGEWRAMALPFLNDAAIEPIRLYLRRPPEDDDDRTARRTGGDGQRFVIEITMSRLGRMQFDGMVRRDDKQFDLILRTEAPLPSEMRRDIMLIFTGAAELCGTKGVVVFQPGRFIDLPAIEMAPTALMA